MVVLLDDNQGTTFTTQGPFGVGAAPFSCVVADLNADGDTDIATANFNANRVTVLLNDGSEEFYSPVATDWSVGTGPRAIVAADFDSNGIPDLATANRDGSTITVRLGSLTTPFSPDCQPNGTGDDCEPDCTSPPFAICQNVTRAAQSGCVANVNPQEVDDFSFDPDGSNVQLSLSPPGPYGIGSTSVTLTVEDDCCHSDVCTALITVVDDQSPTITCPSNRTRGTNSGCGYNGTIGTASASDNCTPSGSIQISNNAPSTFPLGLTQVTWTASDSSGNVAICNQNVTIVDDDSPDITCPVNVSVSTNLGCSYLGPVGTPTATDNCSAFEDMGLSNDAPALFPLGNTSVTWVITDEGGNSDSCVQQVTVVDNQPPSITCPAPVTVQTNSSCAYFGSFGTPVVSDSCSSPGNITITNDAPTPIPLGVTVVTWTATDEAGNTKTCQQSVTVEDGTAPNINCPAAVTVSTNAGCFFNGSTGDASATDNCSLVPNITISNDAPVNFVLGTTNVEWTATDEVGNSSMCTQQVTVVDGQPPLAFCPGDISFDVNSGCSYIGGFGTASGSDACSSVVIDNDAPAAFSLGDTTVTWTVTDQAGNMGTCTQIVSVSDATPPTITCPQSVTLATNVGCTYEGSVGSPTVADNCTSTGSIVVVNDAPSALFLGLNEVTWTATDETGNSSSCMQLVTIEDRSPPSITCPQDFTLAADGACNYEGAFGNATVSDNCSSTGQIVVDNDAPSTFSLGDTVVTWTAVDAAGNSASCSHTVTIVDLVPPVVTCPGDLTVDADSSCRFSEEIGEASATDNCSSSGQISISSDAPAQFSLSSTVVTWTAVDEAGNMASCEQMVTVEDTDPPDLSCPSDRTRGTNAGCSYDGGIGQATTTDNCSDSGDITITNDAPDEFELGLNLVTWSASDAAGNTSTCTQEVTIVDDVPPEISCPSSRTRDADAGCSYGGGFGQATASDNCSSGGEISISNDAPASLPLGLTVVTWTAIDEAGNRATCTQDVTVVDSEPPTLECAGSVEFETNGACAFTGSLADAPQVSDNCSTAGNVMIENDAPQQFPLGATVVTWTATDEAENAANCTQMVTVVDRELPTLSCPASITLSANDDCSYVGDFGDATASDNCSSSEALTVGNDAPSALPSGLTVVTWTATDEAGNVATCTQEVTVVDDELPFLQCPVSFVSEPNVDCHFEGTVGVPLVADNCSTAEEMILQSDAPAIFDLGATIVTWTVTDSAGNQSSCLQEVLVSDVTPPIVTCPGSIDLATNSGCLFVGDLLPANVLDDCTESDDIELTNDAPAALVLGETMVTWTAIDGGGNRSTCTVDVSVEDREDPQIICPLDIVVPCDDPEGAVVDFAASATDACETQLQFSYAPVSGSVFPVGDSIVTCAARDSSGNSTTCTFTVTVECGGGQIPGDCNQDGAFDISDPVCVLGFLFLGRPEALPCGDGRGDDPSNRELYAWGGDTLDLSSAVRGLRFLFFGGIPHPLAGDCVALPGCPDKCES